MAPFVYRMRIHRVGCPLRVGHSLRVAPFEILEFSVPFCLEKTRHYFNHCDLFCSFHAVIKVQFGGLTQLDAAMNNYKKITYIPCTALTLTIEQALRNIVINAYMHYIDTWAMNGVCVGHHAVLMHSMLMFAMHLGWYQRWE